MRVAGVVFAILLIAACPPRRARVLYVAPPCPAPVVPVMPQPVPLGPVKAAKTVDPATEKHLAEWEKKIDGVTNFRTEIELKRTDAVLKRETKHAGVALCMKPNFAVLRLDNSDDPKKIDYEAYICDGKKLYAYDGKAKTITESALPPKWPLNFLSATENPVLGLLVSPNAKEIAERFDVSVFKTDDHYIYLDIKAVASADKRAFTQLRLALYGPNTPHAYLPAQVYALLPSGDSQSWKFKNPQVNLTGIVESNFRFVQVPGWQAPRQKPPEAKPER